MNFIFAYKMAVKSIASNKIRAALTMLGVIIGVAAVIAAVGFAESSMSAITNMIEGMGSNVISAAILDPSPSKQLTLDDIETLEESSEYIESISPYIMSKTTVKSGTETWDTTVVGTDETYLDASSAKMESGRFITKEDIDNGNKVVAVGARGKKELFKGKNPIEQTIRINGAQFTVIGVIESMANGAKGSDDDMVYIPVNVAGRTLKISNVSMFMARASSKDTIDLAQQKIKNFLYDIYKDKDSYIVFTQESMLSILGDVTGIMMTVLGSVATISLVVGGVGIMNIMFVSVTERTREIGIRKAVGAKKRDILIQFLIEALILTGMGGIIGVITGLSIIKFGIGSIETMSPVYSTSWTIASFTIAVSIGVFFGIFPANKAANLNPIEALRSE